MDIAVAGVTACLPRRHLGTVIVTTVDTAGPCSPLKLIQADQQPALSASVCTASLSRVTEPVTYPSKAWVSCLGWSINKRHFTWSDLLITADFVLDKWNHHSKMTVCLLWRIRTPLPLNKHFTSMNLTYWSIKVVKLRRHTFTCSAVTKLQIIGNVALR